MTDCIIVGGGIIGMLTARSLVKRGYSVTLLDRGLFGREASWAGGGILSPLYPWRHPEAVNHLAFASQSIYPLLIRQLGSLETTDPEWIQSGLLMLDVADIDSAKRWLGDSIIKHSFVDSVGVQELEPVLADKTSDNSVYLPNIAQFRPPRFVKAIQTYLLKHGVEMRDNTEVNNIIVQQGRVLAVKTNSGQTLEANKLVITSGAWSSCLLKQLGIDLRIQPVRGQMLLLRAKPDLVNKIVLKHGRYIIPRRDGHIVVGSTLEHVGFDKSTTDQAYADLRRFVGELVPALANAPVIRHWAGLRPGSSEGVPLIGQHPEIEGLFVNAGHFRNGIGMAPASAELLAGLINQEEPILDPSPYSLNHKRLAITESCSSA